MGRREEKWRGEKRSEEEKEEKDEKRREKWGEEDTDNAAQQLVAVLKAQHQQ